MGDCDKEPFCICYSIIGYRLDHEEERQKWLESGGMEKCAAIVEKTAGMLCKFIEGK
jgi:hypothetical protein